MAAMRRLSDDDTSKLVQEAKKIKETVTTPVNVNEEINTEVKNIERSEVFLKLKELPSLGKFYGESGISAQPLKVPDCVIISSVTKDNYMDRYTSLFERRISGISPQSILSADEDYLLIWLRENAFPGYTYTSQPFKCMNPECGKYNAGTPFYYPQFGYESNADEISSDRYDFTLSTGKNIGFSLRRRGHDEMVANYIDKNYTAIGQTISDSEKDLLKLASITRIEGCGMMDERLRYFSEEMEPSEFVELLHEMKKHNLITKVYANVKCVHCETINKARYLFRPSIFLPGYKPKKSDISTV